MKNKLKKLSSTIAIALSVSLPVAESALAKNDFILAQSYPTDHIFHASSEKFMESLEKQNSKMNVEYHPGGDLGDWSSQFEQAMQGAIPMTMTFGASEFDRRLDLSWLGYVVDDWDSARKAYGPGGPMLDVYNTILEDLDLIALGMIPTGFGSIAIRKGVGKVPTNFPEDAKGIKMRVVPSPLGINRFKSWGFSAVPMPYGELYTGLQLGAVDGRSFGPAVEIWQMRDVLETYVLTKDYFEHAFWLVNKDWWENLPDAERAKMQKAVDESLAWTWSEAQNIDEGYLTKVKEAGIKVVELNEKELAKAKAALYEQEWSTMESLVGPKIMAKVKNIAGIN
ncbi:C4-dicarboxylate ABC transporter substrate-binding protein [Endozoicomonas sp. OPT23]|nr:C4-dicarboxylate ABC transporter substrate-binding protein [Endozoicomonas sp. OPT23]